MTTARLTLLQRFRRWRLNRWADQLSTEAKYHLDQANTHNNAAALFLSQSYRVRQLARRITAAGSVI